VFTRETTLADFVASLGKLPLVHQPGEVWEYSWSVDVLARVVEVGRAAGCDQTSALILRRGWARFDRGRLPAFLPNVAQSR
jgi:hypothetical protein